MAVFSFFNNNTAMSTVRTTINGNFEKALPIPTTTNTSATNLVAIIPGVTSNATTYFVSTSTFMAATGTATGANVSLTGTLTTSGNTTIKGNLVVNGTTTLGDAASDTITLKGTVNAAGVSATFSSISANSINVNSFTVGGAAYKAFSASTAAPATNLLWIDTSTSVPVLKYHNGSAWVSIGAVFG